MKTSSIQTPPKARSVQIEAEIDGVIRSVRESLSEVFKSLPGKPRRAQELARVLAVNKNLTSKVERAVRTTDALASAHVMPGPDGLRTLLRAAAKKGVSRGILAAAERAVDDFEQFIRRELGDRDMLDAIISESLPQARQRFELSNKQAVYKAMGNLKGVVANVHMRTYLIHPGADPERFDYAMILGLLGLRRVRPSAVVRLTNVHMQEMPRDDTRLTLDSQPVEELKGLELTQFCALPPPRIEVRRVGTSVDYVITGDGIGPDSAVDLVLAELDRAFFCRYEPENRRRPAAFAEVEQPAKLLVFDVLLHNDVWPDCRPELCVYDTIIRGAADINDPTRFGDRLDVAEAIQFLGHGLARFRAIEVPNYLDMIGHVCEKLGWNPDSFRGYRVAIQYPLYGSQVCMIFDAPPRPAG